MTPTPMAKIDVANATNEQLNWLAAKHADIEVRITQDLDLIALSQNEELDCYPDDSFCPATQVSQGWPMVEHHPIVSEPHPDGGWVSRKASSNALVQFPRYQGGTRLQAVLRCFLAGFYGSHVDVPACLVEPQQVDDEQATEDDEGVLSQLVSTEDRQIPDGNYMLSDGAAWFTVKNHAIRIHATDEGVVTDIYVKGREGEAPTASTYAFDDETLTDKG